MDEPDMGESLANVKCLWLHRAGLYLLKVDDLKGFVNV
jgi:hypothetical protein